MHTLAIFQIAPFLDGTREGIGDIILLRRDVLSVTSSRKGCRVLGSPSQCVAYVTQLTRTWQPRLTGTGNGFMSYRV